MKLEFSLDRSHETVSRRRAVGDDGNGDLTGRSRSVEHEEQTEDNAPHNHSPCPFVPTETG